MDVAGTYKYETTIEMIVLVVRQNWSELKMSKKIKITSAAEFQAFLESIGYKNTIAFPTTFIDSNGRIRPNTSMKKNMCLLSDVNVKNYIWKPWKQHIIIDNDSLKIAKELQELDGKTLKITTRAGYQFVVFVPDEYWEELKRPVTGLKFDDFDGEIDICTPILLQDYDKGYVVDNVAPGDEGRGGWGPGSFKINKKEEIEQDLDRDKSYDNYDPTRCTHYIAEGDDIEPMTLPDHIAKVLVEKVVEHGKNKKVVVRKNDDGGTPDYVRIVKLPPEKLIGDESGKNHDLLNNLEMLCRHEKLDYASSMEILWEGNFKCLKKPSSPDKLLELKMDYASERERKGFKGRYQVLRIDEKGVDEVTLVRMALEQQGWVIKHNIRKRTLLVSSPFCNIMGELSTEEANVKIRNTLKSGIKLFYGYYETCTETDKMIPVLKNFKIDKSIIKDVVAEYIIDHKEDPIYSDVLTVLMEDAEKIVEECWDDEKKTLDDSQFVSKRALKEILSFDPNPNLTVEFPKLSDAYNEWAMFMALYPGVFNTMEAWRKMQDPSYNPAPVFGAIAAFVGGVGCFKSSWMPALLRNLPIVRGQSYYAPINLGDKERTNAFLLEASLYVEIQEGRGLNIDADQTKSFLARSDDFIQHYFSDRPVYTPRRNGFYITSNNPTLFHISDDPDRRYAIFFVSKLPSLSEEAMREMPHNPEQYHNMILDAWAKKHARRVYAEMVAYYLTGRKPGLPGDLEEERVKAFEHSDGSVLFEEDFLSVLKDLYQKKQSAILYDHEDIVIDVDDDWLKTNYAEISYRLERQPYNYSRNAKRNDMKYYTNGSIKKSYLKLTGDKKMPDKSYKYVRLLRDKQIVDTDRGVHIDLMHPKLLELMEEFDNSDPVKDMDREDASNFVSEEVIQNEQINRRIDEEKEKVKGLTWNQYATDTLAEKLRAMPYKRAEKKELDGSDVILS